jgi:NDP-sugar pyrophosphorylase family protein
MHLETNIVFPIAGAGQRFVSGGFDLPKPILNISGYYFFEIAARNLQSQAQNCTLSFIVLEQHCKLFEIHFKIKKVFPNAKIAIVNKITEGSAETVHLGLKKLNLGEGSLIVADCDQWVQGEQLKTMFNGLSAGYFDIALPHFYSSNPGYSYVECDDQGRVSRIAEKNPISNKAVAGCYGFRNNQIFNEMYSSHKEWGKEKYMSNIVAQGISSNLDVRSFDLDFQIPFGTPVEYEVARLDSRLIGEINAW